MDTAAGGVWAVKTAFLLKRLVPGRSVDGFRRLIPPDEIAMGDGDGEGDVVRMGDGHGEEKGEFWADEKWTREERRSGLPEQDRDPVVVAVATGFNIFTFGSPFWATPFACNPTPLIILLQDGALRIFRRRSL